jgi:hypothetical protein
MSLSDYANNDYQATRLPQSKSFGIFGVGKDCRN